MTTLGLRASARLGLSSERRSGATRFLPTRLPGLAFWYDAVGSTYASGTWHDLSGNGNHAAQPLASRQPSRTTDDKGRKLLRFDGVNDALLVNAPPNLSAGLTLFVVYRVRTPVDFHGIFAASASTGTDHQQFFTLQYEQTVNRRIQMFGRSTQPNQVVAQGVDSTETQYAIVTFDDDGVDVELRDLTGIKGDTSTFAPFGTPAVMVLGARYNQGSVFNFGAVDLYEIGLYTRELSPAERDQIESYLQRRHRLVWNPLFIGKDLAWFHDAGASGFTLSGSAVAQWNDLSGNGRHWTQTGAAQPIRTVDGDGRTIVQFDGVDDLLELSAPLPALEPFSVGVVYRVRDRGDFTGIMSVLPPAGTDHSAFWTFRNASAPSFALQLFGRSDEVDPLLIEGVDGGVAQTAVWVCNSATGQLRDALGSGVDSYGGSFGAPAGIVLGGRYGGAPFGFAAIDVLATVGASRALSATDQQRLVDWASARWSLEVVDRRPQDFPNGTPDGITDNTAAIQAAIDAWQPGDQVIISGGTFRTSNKLVISQNGLLLKGDGEIRALSGFPANSALLEVTGIGVTLDTDGLELDQADVMVGGNSIRAIGAVGLQILSMVSRGTQRAFVCIEANTTDLLLAGCEHLGKGYGVIAPDPPGLARLALRDSRFEHFGSGTEGDGVQLNCATFGASFVDVIGCSAIGYIGEANSKGIGFGFAGTTDGRLIGCRTEQCEGDGFHLENGSNRWLCADLIAQDVGIPAPVGGNGSGLIAYDSDDITVVLMLARNCGYHGIALSGQGSVTQRLNGVVERCTVDTTARDGIHMTAQKDFRIDRNFVRDPSSGNPGQYAGIHVARQGGTTLENMDGTGTGNVVVLSGATMPLGTIVVRAQSVNVTIDGVSGGEPWSDGTVWTDGTGWLSAG